MPIKESIQKQGQMPGLLRQILKKAVTVLIDKIRAARIPAKPELKVDMKVFRQMQNVKKKLVDIQKNIQEIDKQIHRKQKRLDELTGLSGKFRLKEKKELMNSISSLLEERGKQSALLNQTVTRAGYRNVDSFMKAFNKSHAMVEEYLKMQNGTENQDVNTQQMQQIKKSVLDKLHKYNEEAKKDRSSCKHSEIVPKKNMEID